MIPLRDAMRRLFYHVLDRAGLIARARRANRRRARILLYHSVAPEESPFTHGLGVTVTPHTFARQLDYLQRYYRVVSLAELTDQISRSQLDDGLVAITFDDGFADNYHYALPLLRDRGLPATLFIVADAVDNRAILWMHRLAYLAEACTTGQVVRAARQVLQRIGGPHEDGAPGMRCLREMLTCEVHPSIRDRILDELSRTLHVDPDLAAGRADLYLTSSQITAMRARAIAVGCHGATHTAFSVLAPAEQEAELRRCWQVVRTWADSPPPMAFPFGEPRHITLTARRLAQKVGHRCLLMAAGGWVTAASTSTTLDRIKVEEESLSEFAARLEGLAMRSIMGLRPEELRAHVPR